MQRHIETPLRRISPAPSPLKIAGGRRLETGAQAEHGINLSSAIVPGNLERLINSALRV
jgi:hypothetical protein